MNEAAARVVSDGLLKGAFDVFDAMLSATFDYTLEVPETLNDALAKSLLAEFEVTLQGKIQNNLGAVALLFSINDAARFSALIQEQEFSGAAALTEEDRAMLREIADPALGGGVTNLMERFRRNVEQLDEVQLYDNGPENAAALTALIGPGGGAARFNFSEGSGLAGAGVAVFSQSLMDLVPQDQLAAGGGRAPSLATEPELSPEEMNDILSGFDSGHTGADRGGGPAMTQGNLDMVLDIGLVATARLGHVEMPIGEIMALGPGSIIEVGHLVDEPVDLLVNGKLIARGDVVVVDEKFGLRITEIVSPRARIESLR